MHLLVSIYTCEYHSSFLKKCKISLKSGPVNGPVLELQHLVSGLAAGQIWFMLYDFFLLLRKTYQ